jgi:CheY-like chemotaxis protein
MAGNAILCVDDENIILDSLKEQLEKYFGYDYLYETAENGEEGLELIEELLED